MRSQDSRGGSGRRSGRGGPRRSSSRSYNDRQESRPQQQQAAAKKTLWQKIVSFFKSALEPAGKPRPVYPGSGKTNGRSDPRPAQRAEDVEVTTPKLYVGNLSYDTTETDLNELFNGVGIVKSAEIVTHKHNDKSKGFGFVLMATVDEAKRAVAELHDKDFMGRKLIVNGAKAGDREPNYRG